jgi:hypothetical protein
MGSLVTKLEGIVNDLEATRAPRGQAGMYAYMRIRYNLRMNPSWSLSRLGLSSLRQTVAASGPSIAGRGPRRRSGAGSPPECLTASAHGKGETP